MERQVVSLVVVMTALYACLMAAFYPVMDTYLMSALAFFGILGFLRLVVLLLGKLH